MCIMACRTRSEFSRIPLQVKKKEHSYVDDHPTSQPHHNGFDSFSICRHGRCPGTDTARVASSAGNAALLPGPSSLARRHSRLSRVIWVS